MRQDFKSVNRFTNGQSHVEKVTIPWNAMFLWAIGKSEFGGKNLPTIIAAIFMSVLGVYEVRLSLDFWAETSRQRNLWIYGVCFFKIITSTLVQYSCSHGWSVTVSTASIRVLRGLLGLWYRCNWCNQMPVQDNLSSPPQG